MSRQEVVIILLAMGASLWVSMGYAMWTSHQRNVQLGLRRRDPAEVRRYRSALRWRAATVEEQEEIGMRRRRDPDVLRVHFDDPNDLVFVAWSYDEGSSGTLSLSSQAAWDLSIVLQAAAMAAGFEE